MQTSFMTSNVLNRILPAPNVDVTSKRICCKTVLPTMPSLLIKEITLHLNKRIEHVRDATNKLSMKERNLHSKRKKVTNQNTSYIATKQIVDLPISPSYSGTINSTHKHDEVSIEIFKDSCLMIRRNCRSLRKLSVWEFLHIEILTSNINW